MQQIKQIPWCQHCKRLSSLVRTQSAARCTGPAEHVQFLASCWWSMPPGGPLLSFSSGFLRVPAHELGILKINKTGVSLLLSFVSQLGENMNFAHHGPSFYTA